MSIEGNITSLGNIHKGKTDYKDYRIITIQSGLEVLLVSTS